MTIYAIRAVKVPAPSAFPPQAPTRGSHVLPVGGAAKLPAGSAAKPPIATAGAVQPSNKLQATLAYQAPVAPAFRSRSILSRRQSSADPCSKVPAPETAVLCESRVCRLGSAAPSIFSEASTAASTPRMNGSPGLSSTWSSFSPPSPTSHSSSPTNQSLLNLLDRSLPAAVDPTQGLVESLGKLVGAPELADALRASGHVSQTSLAALVALGEQAVNMGIDYLSLGQNWSHPRSRMEYRQGQHPSAICPASRLRAGASRQRLINIVAEITTGAKAAEAAVVETFLVEIGISLKGPEAQLASFAGVSAALQAELLLPLRALHEGQSCMTRTYSGLLVPAGLIQQAVRDLFIATLSKPGGFSEWRYNNPVGMEQLRGLCPQQLQKWKEPTSMVHAGGLRTHEDEDGELGFFWSTKIGGPSHGFDFEGQCLLPLLANARNKVVLVSDPAWPAYPVGRAHFRLLWTTAPEVGMIPEPRLWLEHVNGDFDAVQQIDTAALRRAVLAHVMDKAEAMGIPVSIGQSLTKELAVICAERNAKGGVQMICECLSLRPSNGVCEASDFLSTKHDWVQLEVEKTEAISRTLYVPSTYKSPRRLEAVVTTTTVIKQDIAA